MLRTNFANFEFCSISSTSELFCNKNCARSTRTDKLSRKNKTVWQATA